MPRSSRNGQFTSQQQPVQRLTPDHSTILFEVSTICGDFTPYKNMIVLMGPQNWYQWSNELLTACIVAGAEGLLDGSYSKPEPLGQDASIQDYNENLKQIAIYKKKSAMLCGAMNTKVSPGLRQQVLRDRSMSAQEAFQSLERQCWPKHNLDAYSIFKEMSCLRLEDHDGNVSGYAHAMWELYNKYNAISKNTDQHLPMLVLKHMFLDEIRIHHEEWVESAAEERNVFGLGQSTEIDWWTLVRAAMKERKRSNLEAEADVDAEAEAEAEGEGEGEGEAEVEAEAGAEEGNESTLAATTTSTAPKRPYIEIAREVSPFETRRPAQRVKQEAN